MGSFMRSRAITQPYSRSHALQNRLHIPRVGSTVCIYVQWNRRALATILFNRSTNNQYNIGAQARYNVTLYITKHNIITILLHLDYMSDPDVRGHDMIFFSVISSDHLHLNDPHPGTKALRISHSL